MTAPSAPITQDVLTIPRRTPEGDGKRNLVGLTRDQLREIAEMKMVDLNAHDIDAAINVIAGTARSMGLDVQG